MYPEIEQEYKLICGVGQWYKEEHIGRNTLATNLELNKWYRQVKQVEIEEMLNFKLLVEHNEAIIKRYFVNGMQ